MPFTEAGSMGFEAWYADYYDEWHKDRREKLRVLWHEMAEQFDMGYDAIEDVFTTIANAIRDQYGD